jgi:hypothetical protein
MCKLSQIRMIIRARFIPKKNPGTITDLLKTKIRYEYNYYRWSFKKICLIESGEGIKKYPFLFISMNILKSFLSLN